MLRHLALQQVPVWETILRTDDIFMFFIYTNFTFTEQLSLRLSLSINCFFCSGDQDMCLKCLLLFVLLPMIIHVSRKVYSTVVASAAVVLWCSFLVLLTIIHRGQYCSVKVPPYILGYIPALMQTDWPDFCCKTWQVTCLPAVQAREVFIEQWVVESHSHPN